MMKRKKITCLLLISTLCLNLLAPPALRAQIRISTPERSAVNGLDFRLREETSPQTVKPEVPPPVATTDLSEAETNAILRRLPQIKTEPSDEADFALRSSSLPPPKTGNIISIKFPADDGRKIPKVPEQAAAALEVERTSPDGAVPLVSEMSATFSQPMIAVNSQTGASQETVPIKLTPEVKGKWRWLGTKTLIFDAENRFPMATRFTATIPAGTKSAVGGRLPKDFSWSFTTPPPKVEKFAPSNANNPTLPLDTLMAASFNQEIDENAILPKIKVTAGGKPVRISLVTAEANSSYTIIQQLGNLKPKSWIAFRAVESLPPDSEIKVTFESGLPSAEGPLTSAAPQEFSFRTYGPLKFVKSYCGYYRDKPNCEPSDDFHLEFNNWLYPAAVNSEQVKIEPNLENAKVLMNGNHISIQGKKTARTTYKVTISGALKDWFQQPLGNEMSVVFNVGAEPGRFFAQGGDFITLDPNTKKTYSVYSVNQPRLKVKLYAVTPADYEKFRPLLRVFYNNRSIAPTPDFGRLVFDKTVETDSVTDQLTETRIDLSEALPGGFGHALLIVEPVNKKENYDYQNLPVLVWAQSTNLGIDAFLDYERLTAFATDLKTGKPLNNVEVGLFNGSTSQNAVTGESGIVNFGLTDNTARGFLLARNGADTAILRENYDYAELVTDWRLKPPADFLRWFVFDDRKMYRPNEEVSIKGYVRRVTGGKFSDISELGDLADSLRYSLKDSRNFEIAKGTARLNAFGAFDFKLKLPDNISLGNQRLELSTNKILGGYLFEHNFEVQEFRRPEFEVTVKPERAAPFLVGESATINVEAKYYSGGFLSNAPANWNVYAAPTNYTPPNRDNFTFGTFVPWWRIYKEDGYRTRTYGLTTSQAFSGTTGADGKHRITVDFISAKPARPYTLTANAGLQDVNRQNISGSTTLLVHPSAIYVGLRTPKTFVRQGDLFRVETIATDLDGKIAANRDVTIKAVLRDWRRIGGTWQQVEIDVQTCQIKSAGDSPADLAACDFTAKEGGVYTITASVFDDRERLNESELTLWVAGGNTEPKRNVEKEEATLIPDKKDYAPGETAEILVNSPFPQAEGVMTLRRGGIVKTERFTINESSTVLRVPLEERFLPNVHVQVDLVGAADRAKDTGEIDKTLPKRPAFAGGELNLKISKASRKLNVTVEPEAKELEPGGQTSVNVTVKDNSGNGVAGTEVALVAVDEGVLALSNYAIANPLDIFYQDIAGGVADYHSRANLLLGNPDDALSSRQIESLPVNQRSVSDLLKMTADGVSIDGSRSNSKEVYKNWVKNDVGYIITGEEKQQINLRKNFDALAIFSPSVMTDAGGTAQVNIKLPDNLTRYRITAVAVTKSKQFGSGESSITAKQKLSVRPSAPRFLNFGDRAELPVVLQNQTDNPLTVDVAMRAANAELTNGNGKRVTIPANDRAEIRFPVATDKAGMARFQIGATSGNLADAAEIYFPVYTPATTESFATYGTTDQNGAIVQPVRTPKDVFSQFGGLEVTTSSTQLQELTDAFLYLQNYPFGCSEQVSSRILSVAALRDVLEAFSAKDLPSKSEIEAKMKADIERLQKLQHYDGGFSFWRSDDESFPYVSIHVAHALGRARQKNYSVPQEMIAKSLGYLKNIESRYPESYSQTARWALSAYALYTRSLLGDPDAAKATKLLQEATLEKLSPESIGWILSVLADDKQSAPQVDAIRRHLLNRVTETAGAAHFVTKYTDGEYVLLSSDRRADGVILEALLKTETAAETTPENPKAEVRNPKSEDLIPKIVRGLLANRTKGRWTNTQENVFILLALDKYFQTFEKATPNFVARVWLGQTFAGEQKFAGRSVESNLIKVPMNYLERQRGAANLILDKQGAGRLYYRIGLNYAPKSLKLNAADYGFLIRRTYEAVDDEADVRQNTDGSWTIKSGAKVRVKMQMIAPTRRYHVALVDKLPAGLEIINPNLATSKSLPYYTKEKTLLPGYGYNYYDAIWYEHQNLRDERAEAFTTLLQEGIWNYSYMARATTPGNFVVPPAKAEEMYAPETFGRSGTDFVKVE